MTRRPAPADGRGVMRHQARVAGSQTPLRRQTEESFMAQVVRTAKLLGWAVFHVYDSRRSPAGFPDLILVRDDVLLAVELKTDIGELSIEQQDWLLALAMVRRVKAQVWRPASWTDIEAELKGA